ncbi:calcium-binding protein [Leisingera sp. M527]|uniref:calcium-binding protein n=1 Tax=Leisingera sp. M527 TaxID=2867014 RepID=UPI00220724F2|nr:calcium-binding protein [Leisingera sp. M527]UWQ34536.1 calcium-binding protein [Leisingera sp. M527]
MATVNLNDPSGTWSLNDLNSPDFANASITTQTSSLIVFTGTNGAGFSLTGDFSSASPYSWTLKSLSITSYGTPVLSFSGFSMNFYTFASSSGARLEASILAGSDTITSNMAEGQRWLTHGGNDTIKLGTGDDTLYGGSGTDRLIIADTFGNASFSSNFSTVTIDSGDGRDIVSSIEQLEFSNRTFALTAGSYSGNSLTGDKSAGLSSDLILGGAGNDTLSGLSGSDLLLGEDGNDRLLGGAGRDTLNGGDGDDDLWGGSGRDLLIGGMGDDLLIGSKHGDRLLGGGGADELKGGHGKDVLIGNSGNDLLVGGGGSDTLKGESGRDMLLGHKGNDVLTGGSQADTFVFHKGHGNDTITDFTAGEDHIAIGRGASRLSQLDFESQGDDVLVSFANVTILVEDITVAQLQDADNFLF